MIQQQVQNKIQGTLSLFEYISGPVSGTVDGVGHFTLSGVLHGEEIDSATIEAWTGVSDGITGTMNGSFTETTRYTNIFTVFGQQFITYTCDFTATRAD